jgi:DNA-directed RNA polymerase subunit RPC12/RpoP
MGFEWIASKNYKRHYICLKCQKGFKRPSQEDMKHSDATDLSDLMTKYYASDTLQDIVKYICVAHQKLKVACPNCQFQLLQVHYDFEVPRQRDTKSWKNLQKTMSTKILINYETYIHWHRLELQKVVANSVKFKLLTQNVAKLESISVKNF